jgi:integrase
VWTIRAFAGVGPDGKRQHVARTVHGGKRVAQTELSKLVAAVAGRTAPITADVTMSQLLDRWMEEIIATSREPTTVAGYATHIKAIKQQLGRVKLTKLTAQHLDRAYNHWRDAGLSDTTMHHRHAIIRTALHQAMKWELVSRPVTDAASPPPLRSKPITAPQPDVIGRLLRAAEADAPAGSVTPFVLGPAIALAAITGLRLGELCGLRWSDIDAGNGVFHVRRAIKYDLRAVRGQEVSVPEIPRRTRSGPCRSIPPW